MQQHEINFGLVTRIERPNGDHFEEENPGTHVAGITARTESHIESISLASDRASRLIQIFKVLSTNPHRADCHDFLMLLEGWDVNGDIVTDNRIIPDDEQIVSGTPYQVLINGGSADNPDWIYSHSAVGMDGGRLLGLSAQGMPLGTTNRETTMQVHSRGVTAYLATASLSLTGCPTVTVP